MTNEKNRNLHCGSRRQTKASSLCCYMKFFCNIWKMQKMRLRTDRKMLSQKHGKSIDCLRELTDSVQKKNELGRTVLSLYLYVSRQLGIALGSKKAEPLFEAEKVMRRLYEIYKEDAVNDTSDPVMQKSQQVYAGLTYGREDLTVSSQDGSSSRGFYA